MNPFHQPTSEENMSAAKKAGCQGVAMQLLGLSVWLPGCCYAVCSEWFINVALQLIGHSLCGWRYVFGYNNPDGCVLYC